MGGGITIEYAGFLLLASAINIPERSQNEYTPDSELLGSYALGN
ncbi:valyl-tRNA synthetase domain protein [Chlamydia muridarum]|nr:valyl-tRNA synthetase domain protein [Chlamydia muridarum]KDU82647.1 valyl-tRNA synthetase domain protein [Chlamydia muridarum]KDU83541.1 valyl-tRNA synthetase domain protein [Chlamydia muridarum]KDU84524.1 hypothetical protein DU21_0633 [Chlamydia muridarum]